ncbi:alpha-amylase family glycosyl hydrolase [Prosthecobacter sp.]|uniref:alpha-amylase family glycosyl hydrolase n=1 Tax=Prosthecobacter sp. TaxID=1965333 RepID=UPI002AB922D4|nr:alpha-amylase family glycosyl hydrolase [Prosthecobacter sp.]MDZ4402138.1 alpha-amylase family glycosyl hydrolase [Prosthecobacter sp.]
MIISLHRFCRFLALLCVLTPSLRAETMLQYFNTSWVEITNKMPELAEAGYSALWLPPPTKGSGGLSVGYDMWDPFDLGSKNQRGSIKTRYGTEAELIRLVETAHRFGIRIYFDNIMNHRAFDVPGYNETTPVDLYPGLVPEDFHLRKTQDGFYRKWDNTRSWNDAWQVQNLGLADLIDIAQEPGDTNQNFGSSEGSTALKIKFIRDLARPEHYCYLPNGTYVGFGPGNGITTELLQANPSFYSERVEDYLNRAARWLIDRTKGDGLRLDAVKHVRSDFFGATFGADKDSSDYGYTGQVQRQFNISRGFSDTNHRDSVFNTETGRDDAMLFGEHLGEPPAYGPYIDSGMRLVDNVLREQLNGKLGNPSSGLEGFDAPGSGGFGADVGVMHAQSHDNDYAARRELQHAFYFLRQGLGLLYTDGNYQAETLGESGGAFPRHANTSFLGQWADGRVPNLLYVHDQFARGYQVGRWSDGDFVAWERIDKRENPSMSDENGVTLLVMLNDNYASGQARGSLGSAFPAGAYLYNYSWYGGGFYKFKEELGGTVVPAGGYFLFSWKNPDPSELWKNFGGRPITITQNGVTAVTVTVNRKDGSNGDKAFSGGTLPEASRPVLLPDTNLTDYTYSAEIPRITDGTAVRFIARTDGSAANILLKLDGGINLNAINHAGGDSRDNPPAVSTDTFHGYEQPAFVSRIHPELFAAKDTARNATGSAGAETFTTSTVVNGTTAKFIDADTAAFLYHDPAAPVGNITPARNQYDAANNEMWAKANSVGAGYKMFLYYTNDGSNPEGAGGRAYGTTKVAEMIYRHNDDGGASDWWSAVPLPVDFNTTSKYKIGIYKDAAPSWWPGNADAVTRKQKMLTTFETSVRDLTTTVIRPHADYGAEQTGLSEGMHVIRARAFLNRGGQASIYNTFTQSFYFDAQRPLGEIRFPETNGDTVGGSEYGGVVRTDSSVTEVWYNITDGDATNDDGITRSLSGNGGGYEPFTDSDRDGVRDAGEAFVDLDEDGTWDATLATSWVKATEVTPSLSFQALNPVYQKEWRLNYTNIPATGSATIQVRLRELSSAAYKDFALSDVAGHFTTLQRTVTTAGPDIRMFIAYPQNHGDLVGDGYVMKVYFTKSLADGLTTTQLRDRFTIRIGSNDDGGVLTAYSRDAYTINLNETDDCHALAFTLPNLYNDQPDYLHKIEVTHDRPTPTPDISTTRLVRFMPSQVPRISIDTPPDLDSDGKPFDIILPDVAAPTADQRRYTIRVATAADATSVTLTINNGPMDIAGESVVTTEGNTKFWDFTWQNMTQGEFRFTATVFAPGGENHDTRNARVFFRQVTPASATDPDDDDDGLLDGDEATATPLPNGYLVSPKPNPETWTNGEIHIYHAFGKSDPHNPDSDGDGLPDALEVGWRGPTIIGETFSDTGYGSPTVIGAGNGLFDWTDTNNNGVHDAGEASETWTDADLDLKYDFGTIPGVDTNGDGILNFIGDLDPPFYNTIDNLNNVPGVNTLSEGGDRAKQLRGSVTSPDDPDTDNDGIKDGVEDANRDGWLQGDGESLATNANPSLARTWPDGVRNPGEIWTETDPNNADTDGDGAVDGNGEDKDFNGSIAGDTNTNRIWESPEEWSESDPLKADTDADGLTDGWEARYNLDPLDNGTLSFRGVTALAVNGPNGDPDLDGFSNLQEITNGTSPRENNIVTPPPPGQIVIGPQTPVVAGGVSNNREFTDWAIGDLIALDEYNGDGTNNQGSDLYRAYDGFDSSRDLVAFYAHDGGSTGAGGDGNFYFRVDVQDLAAFAEDANLDIYVVIDFNSPANGESALPDGIDTRTNMKWEAVVACYATDSGAVYVDTPLSGHSTAFDENPTDFGVVRRTQADANGFKKSWFNSKLDAVEFSISRQALMDAGWLGDASTLNFQVYTTKDGSDIAGRGDIRDSIYDDNIASDYWRDQSTLAGAGSVLKAWFGPGGSNDRFKRVKVASLIHESRPLLAGSEVQALINNGAGAGWYRPLDVHEAYGVPMALHLTPTLGSAIQWAKVDPAVSKPWRDGPAFNARLDALVGGGVVHFVGTTYGDHIASYFPLSYTQTNFTDANTPMADLYHATPVTVYPPEQVLRDETYSDFAASGFSFSYAEQARHFEKWFGRSSALGNDGYRLNRIHGVKVFAISDQPSQFRFQNTDGGLNTSLRELLNRKARSATQDQVVILGSDWSDFTTKTSADGYDVNIAWMASRPWIQITTPEAIAAGEVDSNRNGTPDVWPFVERNAPTLPIVSKDFVHFATQENYDNWYFGQAGREESLNGKIFNIRPGVPLPAAFGQVGVSGLVDTAWTAATTLGISDPSFGRLARGAFHSAMWLTAFHDQPSANLAKFSTGDYIYPDTSFNNLAGFSKAAQSQFRWAKVYQRVSQWAASAATLANSVSTAAEDADLDGEDEYLLFNDRVFAMFERIGGRMTCAFVRDLVNGKVMQVVGNPHSYAGFETEEEGNVNVSGTQPGSYRTSGFKDWFATGVPDALAYVNNLYSVTTATNGFTFTSSDGKIAKTITLAARGNSLRAVFALTGGVTTLYQRHGLSPHLANLLTSGQTYLGSVSSLGGIVSLTNNAPDAVVRAYIRTSIPSWPSATYNGDAIDDDPVITFDTLNMRNQAQTQQIELTITDGDVFEFGLETGPTLSESTDGDALPDAWETANNLNAGDSGGINGDSGNPDGDAYTNLQEFILGNNPRAGDRYQPVPAKVVGGFELTFTTIPDRLYRVFYSDNLTSWNPLTADLLGTGSPITITDPTPPASRFYRVEVRLVNP